MLNSRRAPAILAALVALLTYAVTLRGTFIYDDFDVFGNDARLHHPDQWKKYWTESYNGGVDNLYRPLVSMTYAIQWWMGGDETKWPYHAVNILLHAAVAACVAEFTRRLISLPIANRKSQIANTAAYISGVLFAVHPVHVEAVANVIGRAELLCAMGILAALILFLHRPLTISRTLAIFCCCAIAILSKEQGILTPFLLLALALCTGFRPVDRDEKRALTTLVLLLCWSLAGYLLLRETLLNLKFEWERNLLDWTINPMIRCTGADRVLMPIVLLGRYASLLLAPIKLSPDYGANVIGSHVRFDDPYLYAGILTFIACVFASVVVVRKNWRLSLFCLIALGMTYAVISNFVFLIGTNFGERLLYTPSIFFIILIAMAIAWFTPRGMAIAWFTPRGMAIALTCVLAGAGMVRSIDYARRWNGRLSFYQRASLEQPDSIRLRMLIIAELMSQHRLDEAKTVADAARALLPQYDEIWVQSADLEIARENFDLAEKYLRHAMTLPGQGAKAAGRLQKIYDRPPVTSQPASSPSR